MPPRARPRIPALAALAGALALLPGCLWEKPLLTVAEGELPPLHRAARAGDRAAVARLLQAKVDLEAPAPTGETALVQACWYGQVAVATMLLEQGAALQAHGPSGIGALEAAALGGHHDLARQLLRRGARIANPAQFGSYARLLLGLSGQAELARELEAAGLPPDPPEPSRRLQQAVLQGDPPALRRLLAAPVPPEQAAAWTKGRRVALDLACVLGDLEAVGAFLEAGVSPTRADEAGRTPLHKVYEGLGLLSRAQVVVDPEAAPTVMGLLERQLGRRLAASRHAAVIRHLVETGADPEAKDGHGKTPEDMAVEAWRKLLERMRKVAWKP